MNSYFASVEQQANVFLRGKSVGVCAYLSNNGCIIASSMEAKKKGIKTGSLVRQGVELDPDVVLVQNDPPKYRTVTKKIFQILSEYTTDLETYSIDEAFLDITALVRSKIKNNKDDLQIAQEIGKEINTRIKQEIGEWLRSSVGISRTRFLAKLVSDTGPKDSVTVVDEDEVPEYIGNLKLVDIWGINWRMEKRFNDLGITTPLDLYNSAPHHILRTLNKPGYYLWAGLHGLKAGATKTLDTPKSVGHSYCLSNKTTDKEYLARVLMKLCEKTGRRMRENEVDARTITTYWSYVGLGGNGKSHKLYAPIYDSWDIFKHAWAPLQDLVLPDKIRMLAVSVSSFVPISQQMDLFEQEEDDPSSSRPESGLRRMTPTGVKRSLNKALDKVNSRYGEFTVMRGSMWGTDKNAPDRIGFRKTVSWKD